MQGATPCIALILVLLYLLQFLSLRLAGRGLAGLGTMAAYSFPYLYQVHDRHPTST